MARLVLLFLLWIGVTVSTEVDLHKRIIVDQTCGSTERQYHVKLSTEADGSSLLCGGSLISDQWILTAAHCKFPYIYAVLGVHPGPGQVVKITHPPLIFMDKDENNNDRIHDIMLLKLPHPTKIRPVKLPDCKESSPDPKIGDKVQLAGYGATAAGPDNKCLPGESKTLQCVDLDVVDCKLQNTLHTEDPKFYDITLHWNKFCAKTPQKDVCKGDSGGGVVYRDRIYGVLSFSVAPKKVFIEPAVFINICHKPYLEWIKQTTGVEAT